MTELGPWKGFQPSSPYPKATGLGSDTYQLQAIHILSEDPQQKPLQSVAVVKGVWASGWGVPQVGRDRERGAVTTILWTRTGYPNCGDNINPLP